jgi:MFS family permease
MQQTSLSGDPARTDALQGKGSLRRAIISSTIGSTIEWYDFFIYATASVLVFNKLFFPNMTPLVGTLVALTSYAIGFIVRPLGGLVFGPLGDRKGRKVALVITLLISGSATVVVGLLPGYAQIGFWAPLALLIVRVLHGFSIGGEQANAILIACEHAPDDQRGFYGSWIQLGAPLGYLLPLGLFTLLTQQLSNDAFMSWGWRVPFLLASVMVCLGLYIRLQLTESPAFIEARKRRQDENSPLRQTLRLDGSNLLLGIGAKLAEGVTFSVYSVLVSAYAVNHGFSKAELTSSILIALLIECPMLMVYGWLSDKLGRRPIYLLGAVTSVFAAPLVFYAAWSSQPELLRWSLVLALAVGHGAMYGAQAAFLAELFPVQRRASGLSFVLQIGSMLSSGLGLLAGWLLNVGDGTPWYLVAYVIVNVLITIVATVKLRESAPRVVSAIGVA